MTEKKLKQDLDNAINERNWLKDHRRQVFVGYYINNTGNEPDKYLKHLDSKIEWLDEIINNLEYQLQKDNS